MAEKILVTGFERFGPRKRPNASGEIVVPSIREKYGESVETLVLPVAYDIAAEQLTRAIEDIDPAAVVMFGVSAYRGVRLETQAKNRRFSAFVPDNNGRRHIGRISPDGPRTYQTTLPVLSLKDTLTSEAIPARLSSDAGTFICNEVMYRALEATEQRKQSGRVVPTGFVHLGQGMHDAMVAEAADLIIGELQKDIQ